MSPLLQGRETVSPTWATFLFETANFLILMAVLSWLLFRPMRQAIENRRKALAQADEEAATKQAEVDQLQAEIRQRYATLDTELDRLRGDARAAAEQEAAQLRNEMRAAIEREREVERRRLAHLEDAQLERLAAAVAQAAAALVERLLRQLGGPDVERGLIQAACRELGALDGNDLGAVLIESAHPLDQEMQDIFKTALDSAASTLDFRVIPDLGAGVRISTSRGLIDATAIGLATFAHSALAEQLSTPANGWPRLPNATSEDISSHA